MQLLKFSLVILFLFTVQFAIGQDGKIEQLKRTFLIENLDLSPQEADKFFVIYNEYDSKKRELKKALKREVSNGSDKEMRVERILDQKQEVLNLQKEYYQKLSQVIPESKLVKLEGLENEFRKMLYQRLKD
jgi:hypothetical protein